MSQQSYKTLYGKTVYADIAKRLGVTNPHQVPRIKKVVINRGLGANGQVASMLKASREELAIIAGQAPIVTKSKKSIAGFKIREDMAVGCTVTLRGERMYAFLDRLINLALPRIRDFRGISPSGFDGNGNYTLGLVDQLLFPEVDFDSIPSLQGMNISIVTTAANDQETKLLLETFGVPFASN